jgi:hypothetical protein
MNQLAQKHLRYQKYLKIQLFQLDYLLKYHLYQ